MIRAEDSQAQLTPTDSYQVLVNSDTTQVLKHRNSHAGEKQSNAWEANKHLTEGLVEKDDDDSDDEYKRQLATSNTEQFLAVGQKNTLNPQYSESQFERVEDDDEQSSVVRRVIDDDDSDF